MNHLLLGAKLFAIAVLFVEIFVPAAMRYHIMTGFDSDPDFRAGDQGSEDQA
jgi:hypothetical protein